jgi:hypothetical protein
MRWVSLMDRISVRIAFLFVFPQLPSHNYHRPTLITSHLEDVYLVARNRIYRITSLVPSGLQLTYMLRYGQVEEHRRKYIKQTFLETTCYSPTMTRIRRKGDRTLARYYLTKAARIRIKRI